MCRTITLSSRTERAGIRHHDSHLLLWYAGYDDNVQEQYIALTMVAAALAQFNALAVLNEHAHTSLPIAVVSEIVSQIDGYAASWPTATTCCSVAL